MQQSVLRDRRAQMRALLCALEKTKKFARHSQHPRAISTKASFALPTRSRAVRPLNDIDEARDRQHLRLGACAVLAAMDLDDDALNALLEDDDAAPAPPPVAATLTASASSSSSSSTSSSSSSSSSSSFSAPPAPAAPRPPPDDAGARERAEEALLGALSRGGRLRRALQAASALPRPAHVHVPALTLAAFAAATSGAGAGAGAGGAGALRALQLPVECAVCGDRTLPVAPVPAAGGPWASAAAAAAAYGAAFGEAPAWGACAASSMLGRRAPRFALLEQRAASAGADACACPHVGERGPRVAAVCALLGEAGRRAALLAPPPGAGAAGGGVGGGGGSGGGGGARAARAEQRAFALALRVL
jgi:hypothetical protein